MDMNEHQHHQERPMPRAFKWVLCGMLIVTGFFLLTEHQAHLFGILPYLLLAACPLMHLFMHHGHHGGHGHHDHSEDSPSDRSSGATTGSGASGSFGSREQ